MRVKRTSDPGESLVESLIDVFVGEPQHPKLSALQKRLTFSVCGALGFVDRSIYFNDQSLLGAVEVHDQRTDRMLAAKLPAFQSAVPQGVPQCGLALGLRLPKASRGLPYLTV